MTVNLIPADLLMGAADIIVINGLYKGDLFDYEQHIEDDRYAWNCRVCTMGAINIAATGDPAMPTEATSLHLVEDLYGVVQDFLGIPDIDTWNDADERTLAEVEAALRGAAELARERAS